MGAVGARIYDNGVGQGHPSFVGHCPFPILFTLIIYSNPCWSLLEFTPNLLHICLGYLMCGETVWHPENFDKGVIGPRASH